MTRALKLSVIFIVFSVIFMVFSFADVGIARVVPRWSYARLWKESDLVLIVKAGETRDATIVDPVLPFDNEHDQLYLTAVVTELEVLAVLKGHFEHKRIELSHYRLDWEKLDAHGIKAVGNGPNLTVFEAQQNRVSRSDPIVSIEVDYMVFLKKNPVVQYTFVTGQVDPHFSVRQIHLSVQH